MVATINVTDKPGKPVIPFSQVLTNSVFKTLCAPNVTRIKLDWGVLNIYSDGQIGVLPVGSIPDHEPSQLLDKEVNLKFVNL